MPLAKPVRLSLAPKHLLITWLASTGLLAPWFVRANDQVSPLPSAHAHNDYEHERPLLDALAEGFTSIEADVYLVDGELLVAHDRSDVKPQLTLEKLYLKPLLERVRQNGGRVYPGGGTVTLLVDIKRDGAATYAVLEQQLARYQEMLSVTRDGQYTEKAVTVVISGDRPFERITASDPRYAGIDGRLSDLPSTSPAHLLPLISDNWGNHFKYRGQGEMSGEERARLREIITQAHVVGRRVRFWATPESETLWQELRAANVDLIGTDDLRRLAVFLRN